MQTTEASSSPFILDLEMSEQILQDIDLDFFNSSIPYASGSSPDNFLPHEQNIGENSDDRRTFASPASPNLKHKQANHPIFHETRPQESSTSSSVSPPGSSFHDSSSDSSGYKRKASSDSSRSALTGRGDIMMDESDWKVEDMIGGSSSYGLYSGTTIDPSTLDSNFDFNDKAMEDSFDFIGASGANSPMQFSAGPLDMESPEMQPIKHDSPRKSSLGMKARFRHHTKVNSQNSITQSMHGLTTSGSREVSPLSAMVTSQSSSPSAWNPANTPSPNGGPDFVTGAMLNSSMKSPWGAGYDHTGQNSHFNNGHAPSSVLNHPSPLSSGLSIFDAHTPAPKLFIHPTPLKSRVETQIPIKMTLFPMPAGITKLHLPTHTISKPKLLSKPLPERSPDMLELYTTLVCTSAMQNSDFRRRACDRAATSAQSSDCNSESAGDESPDEDDENRPLNGGEVKICAGCITRERKRAARKKVKKIEEEESWHKDESKRVIVFNTHEVKDWQPPSVQVPSEATGDRVEPVVPEGALQVDVPMRIACYCRHQNEKLGFQVIFTLKDCNDRLVAQEISSSIMITDDHKTHNIPTLSTQTSNGSDGLMSLSSAGNFKTDPSFEVPPVAMFRNSHSSSDLQSLQGGYPIMYHSGTIGTSSHPSQTTSAIMTPRNLSRQASPSAAVGPFAKKRKASGSSKVPSGLAMTKLETSHSISSQNVAMGSTSSTAATTPSPYTPSTAAFQQPQDLRFGQLSQPMQSLESQFNTRPSTPNTHENPFSFANRSQSMENLVLQQLYSAPPSAHPSRAPSPTGLRNNPMYQQHHSQQLSQAISNVNSNGFFSLPTSAVAPHRSPTIHKMIPNEGPKAGGIEVTCLGSGFFQGLEVMFGDTKATTTTFWGETSLVCLLPPATTPGLVLVTLKHQQQMQPYPTPPLPKQQVFFNYVDDDEQQIIRTALQVLGHKMTGKSEDIRELARRIIGDGPTSWGASSTHTPSGGTSHQQRSVLNPASFGIDVEATLLRCLDLIDLDDSPRMPRLNLRRPSGQTMLHLACSLGLHRVVAALLARGANPDPRDKGGFTPMHFAAMHNYPQIVRRLILCGADPTLRSLQGYTPAEMSTTDEVLHATRRIEHHRRTRSGGSLRSRTSSATSLRSLWEPPSTLRVSSPPENETLRSSEASQDEIEDEDDDKDVYEDNDDQSDGAFWMQSRRPSAQINVMKSVKSVADIEVPALPAGLASPTAAMSAFRDQLAAHIQHLQHIMQLNLPNLPQMPNLPDYQAFLPTTPMVRRISSLVPHMGSSRPNTSDQTSKETDSRWWDLFSGTFPMAPPAYDEIFPLSNLDAKKASAAHAAVDAVADNKCVSLFDQTEVAEAAGPSVASTSTLLDTLQIGDSHLITQEQQHQLRIAHAEKVKRLRSDRNLFFIWIPLLVIIVVAMLYNNLPTTWSEATRFINSMATPSHDICVVDVR